MTIEQEQYAQARLAQMIEEYREDIKIIWHWGDGNGGHVLSEIFNAYSSPAQVSQEKPKKKTLSANLKKKVLERDAYRCIECGTHIDLSVDHKHPESKGGSSDINNLQTLCRPCNSRKGVKVISGAKCER